MGSNPTPSAITTNRPQTPINTGVRVFGMASKWPFPGQASLKVSLLRWENQCSNEGSHKERFQKFLRSAPVQRLMNLRLVETSSEDFLEMFAHPKAGVSSW